MNRAILTFAGGPTTAKGKKLYTVTGLELMETEGGKNYMLSPITKRGVISSCWIELPVVDFWNLVATMEEAGQRPTGKALIYLSDVPHAPVIQVETSTDNPDLIAQNSGVLPYSPGEREIVRVTVNQVGSSFELTYQYQGEAGHMWRLISIRPLSLVKGGSERDA